MNLCFGVGAFGEGVNPPEKVAVGGAIAGGAADFYHDLVFVSLGGAVLGGEVPRLANAIRVATGGCLFGGESDYEGDMDKVVSVTFLFKAPETLFVPPSERWDIPRLMKELE
jgi:hypothetical protein